MREDGTLVVITVQVFSLAVHMANSNRKIAGNVLYIITTLLCGSPAPIELLLMLPAKSMPPAIKKFVGLVAYSTPRSLSFSL